MKFHKKGYCKVIINMYNFNFIEENNIVKNNI